MRLRKSTALDATTGGTGDDIDTVLKHHHDIQEKLVEGMLHLVTDLKENAKVIGKIAQDDTAVSGGRERSEKISCVGYVSFVLAFALELFHSEKHLNVLIG